MSLSIRPIAEDDYAFVISRLDEWWGGRDMVAKLPRLFFEHLGDAGLIAEDDGRVVGFLAGFMSTAKPGEAYIHFVGVDPAARGKGVGRELYQRYFAASRERGAVAVNAMTSPVNRSSVEFHRAMGFAFVPGDAEVDGISYHRDHNGPGGDAVVFRRGL